MPGEDLRELIIKKLEALNKAMPEHRKIDGEIRSLKAETHTLNAKMVSSDAKFSSADFVHLAENALKNW